MREVDHVPSIAAALTGRWQLWGTTAVTGRRVDATRSMCTEGAYIVGLVGTGPAARGLWGPAPQPPGTGK